jgi:hypothetical protein
MNMTPANPNYFIRLKTVKGKPKPITLVKQLASGLYCHLMGLDTQLFDEEIWVTDSSTSNRLTVAIDWFAKKYKRSYSELTGVEKQAIKTARMNGAAFSTIAKIYRVSASTARNVVHQRGTTNPTQIAA